MQAFKDFQFTHPYSGMENVFEDATINQEANTISSAANRSSVSASFGNLRLWLEVHQGGAQAIAAAALTV